MRESPLAAPRMALVPGLRPKHEIHTHLRTGATAGVVPCAGGYAAAAKSLQSCLTLCDPTDSSPPGFAVPGILQARKLEWVAISFSNS